MVIIELDAKSAFAKAYFEMVLKRLTHKRRKKYAPISMRVQNAHMAFFFTCIVLINM